MPETLTKPKRAQESGVTAPGRGKSSAELVRQSNRWRDNYNPLRSLVIARVIVLLEQAERGDYAEMQLTLRKIEKRFPVLKALKNRRLSALQKLDWDIKTVDELPEGSTQAQAEAQQQFLRSRYELIENLTEAIGFLELAEIRGFSHLQKHRYAGGENDGAVKELHWLPQWTWARDGQFGDWFYNKDSQSGPGVGSVATLGESNRLGGPDLPLEDFIVTECDTPLYEIALIAFVNWAMGRKDWAAFVEIFGLPSAIVIMPANIPVGKETEYQASAEKVADGVSGALPNGSDAKFPSDSVRGNAPFKEFCEAQDSDVVLAGTGGLLTMLSLPTGIGSGASEQHDDAFDDIAQASARKINSVLQKQFDKVEIGIEFPDQPCLAYFELAAQDEDDVDALVKNVVALEGIGLQSEAEEVSEKIGLKLARIEKPAPNMPVAPEPTPSPSGRGQGEGEPLRNRTAPESRFVATIADKVDPVLALLNRITEIKDDASMMDALQKFLAHAQPLAALVAADVTRQQRALEQITAPAFAAGLQGQPVKS